MIRKLLAIFSYVSFALSLGHWASSSAKGYPVNNHLHVSYSQAGECILYACPHGGDGSLAWKWLPALAINNQWVVFELSMPMWTMTIIFSGLFWSSYAPLRRRIMRRRLGLCLTCGYDLRASRFRCPECGSPMSRSLEAPMCREIAGRGAYVEPGSA